MLKFSLYRAITSVFVLFSGFYLYGLLRDSPFQPVFFVLAISTIYYFALSMFTNKDIKMDLLYMILLLLWSLLFYEQTSRGILADGYMKAVARIYVPTLFFPISYGLLSYLTKVEVEKLAVLFIDFSILLFSVDTLFRIFFAPYSFSLSTFFRFSYTFKGSSLLFADSNFTGVYIMSCYFLLEYISSHLRKCFLLQRALLIALLLLTYSRGAILSFILFSVIRIKRRSLISTALHIPIALFFTSLIVLFVSKDGSFQTKLRITEVTFSLLAVDTRTMLFGVGSGNLANIFRHASHNLFGLTAELGLVGLGLYSLNLFVVLKKTGFDFFKVVVPVLVAGFSLFPIAYLGPMYVSLAFMATYNSRLQSLSCVSTVLTKETNTKKSLSVLKND